MNVRPPPEFGWNPFVPRSPTDVLTHLPVNVEAHSDILASDLSTVAQAPMSASASAFVLEEGVVAPDVHSPNRVGTIHRPVSVICDADAATRSTVAPAGIEASPEPVAPDPQIAKAASNGLDVVPAPTDPSLLIRKSNETNIRYARRLHLLDPTLSIEKISAMSYAGIARLRSDAMFNLITPRLRDIYSATPVLRHETALSHARRVAALYPELTPAALDLLTGVSPVRLHLHTAPGKCDDDVKQALQLIPRADGESRLAHARRIRQAYPTLSTGQIAHLSDTKESNLRADPVFQQSNPELDLIRASNPPKADEKKTAYARRICNRLPHLTAQQLSTISGVPVRNILLYVFDIDRGVVGDYQRVADALTKASIPSAQPSEEAQLAPQNTTNRSTSCAIREFDADHDSTVDERPSKYTVLMTEPS